MKTLVLVRHAKSSWKDDSIADRDRPLNKRGKRDAPVMARRLAELVGKPDLILSSPARRALATARVVAEATGYPIEAIHEDERIYQATPAGILAVIRGLEDGIDRVFLVGHNPGLTELVNELSEPAVDNVPTCGVVDLRLTAGGWAGISRANVRRQSFLTPKGEPSD
ncbi:MAG TPA: histidine phosphatase family protein [Gemmatimonadota bacterium]|nr:histidine phosphatase family protein [Gemmatimonadota bacterium]